MNQYSTILLNLLLVYQTISTIPMIHNTVWCTNVWQQYYWTEFSMEALLSHSSNQSLYTHSYDIGTEMNSIHYTRIQKVICNSNMTSFFRFVDKRAIYRWYNLIRTCAGECDWLFHWLHKLCATFSANVNINYRLPIKVRILPFWYS